MKTKRKKNPYLLSYIRLTLICCTVLSLIFFYANHISIAESQKQLAQKKVDLLMSDLESQLPILEEIALKISIDNKYQPYFFHKTKYNEKVLLDDFVQYSNYSVLTTECFLYYGSEKLFLSSGDTESLDIYFDHFDTTELQTIRTALSNPKLDKKIITLKGDMYVMIPFRVSNGLNKTTAVICYVIRQNSLTERFQIVSGGINGTLALYKGDDLLYCNQINSIKENSKNTLCSLSLNQEYTFFYTPEKEHYITSPLLPLQILLVLADVLLVFMVAGMFANKSYKPILEMSAKFRKKITLSEDVACENAFAEIDFLMESLLRNNALANMQIQQKQDMLRKQILLMLINGNYSANIQLYLDKLQIMLPGPYFYVISLSFEKETILTEEFCSELLKELNQIFIEDNNNHVYAVYDYDKKLFIIICSITNENQKDELTEFIYNVAESYSYVPVIGVGNTYRSLSRLSASWLESQDYIHKKINQPETTSSQEYIYDSHELYRLSASLSQGDEENALIFLDHYIAQSEHGQASFLMQQYIFANFLSEVTKKAAECNVELPKQCVSLMITAKNIDSFKEAAQYLIHEFCEIVNASKRQTERDDTYKIYEYVNTHFAEYDMSIEKAATDLNTTIVSVRQAIYAHTGQKYRDYIIHLRIEYAKELLTKEGYTVAETCQHVGYGNISYFIKLFRETTGVTPAQYKRGIDAS